MPELRVKCQSCGEFNATGPSHCQRCGGKLRSADRRLVTRSSLRKCPFCAESIQAAAVVCRFCNRESPPAADAITWVETGTREPLINFRHLGIMVAAVVVFEAAARLSPDEDLARLFHMLSRLSIAVYVVSAIVAKARGRDKTPQ